MADDLDIEAMLEAPFRKTLPRNRVLALPSNTQGCRYRYVKRTRAQWPTESTYTTTEPRSPQNSLPKSSVRATDMLEGQYWGYDYFLAWREI
uniref:Uncharacterized protein n=1 Tax=Gadus morhua TaxID=8049 RepID=A0A8C5FQ97_GADMO